jgi:hypothetical protein
MSIRWFEWPDAPARGDAADWTHSTDELHAALTAAPVTTAATLMQHTVEALTTSPPAAHESGALPQIIVTNRPLRLMTTDALAALAAANDPPRTFAREGDLVRVRRDAEGVPLIEALSEAALRGRLTRCADFFELRKAGETSYLKHVAPPLDVVRDLHALDDIVDAFPVLNGISEVPPLRPDGTLQTVPGYDPATKLVYAPPAGFVLPSIPTVSTASEVAAARALLEELVCDFPFVDNASRANALAALLTPFVRSMIAGCVPLGVFDKPKQGTGASLLVLAIVQVVTGRDAATVSAPDEREEWRKLITSVLLNGRTFVLIDNVTAPLRSAHLARALTTPVWEDRVLGESRQVRIPQRAVWYVTGNNIKLSGDMPRRGYWIRQDARVEHPEDRPASSFRHPDLLGWVATARPQLVAAVLMLARHWVADGCPRADVPTFGSFEGWTRVIGGILSSAGITDFLGNRKIMREELDDEHVTWNAFFAAWYERLADRAVRTADVVAAIRSTEERTDIFGHRIPPWPRHALPSGFEDPEERSYATRLGTAFRGLRDQVFGTLKLQRGGRDGHGEVALWHVELIAPADSAGCADSRDSARGLKAENAHTDGHAQPPPENGDRHYRQPPAIPADDLLDPRDDEEERIE